MRSKGKSRVRCYVSGRSLGFKAANRLRWALIDKDVDGTITPSEKKELSIVEEFTSEWMKARYKLVG